MTHSLRLFVAVLLVGSALFVRRADALPELSPPLYESGNLRIAVGCAENRLVTPDAGLAVWLDDAPLRPRGTNAVSSVGVDSDNNQIVYTTPVDVGFIAPPGRHRVRIEVPDCFSDLRDVDVYATHATHIEGDLVIASGRLMGPVGAPDGFGLLVGAYTASLPRSLSAGTTSTPGNTRFTIDDSSITGVYLSTTIERRYFVFGVDTMFGVGSTAGRLYPASGASGPFDFTGSHMQMALTLRFGARLPLRYAVIAAGSGVGGSMWTNTGTNVDPGGANKYDAPAMGPQGVNVLWHVPLWAAVTVKPFCNWGVQVGASYNVEPTNLDGSFVTLNAALLWQPSSSCARTPNVEVSP